MKPLYKWIAVMLFANSGAFASDNTDFDIVAELQAGPGNVTATADGRVIMSLHQFYKPDYSVVEYKDHSLQPFPNREWSATDSTAAIKLDSVLGIRSDNNGVVWMLDNGMRSGVTPKLVGWNTKTNKLQRLIYLPAPIAPKDAFVNDFALDTTHAHAFISDPAGGNNAALIVVDLLTGSARRVLQGHRSVIPENVDLVINQVPVQIKTASGELTKPHIGVNPITEDLANEWVYFGAMHGLNLYRIKASDLINTHLSETELAERVERYSAKPISDGISIDKNNNIYLGDLANNAIGVINPNRQYRQLAQSPQLSWVDSFSFGADGELYAVVNRLHQSEILNGGNNQSKPPYYLLNVKALATGLSGR